MQTFIATFFLCLAGFCWGSTGIFVRILSLEGFTSFELLTLRMVVVFALLLPLMFLQYKKYNELLIHPEKRNIKLITSVGLLMLLYYLGAIIAINHLPIVIAVLLFGSSPLIAWVLRFLSEKRVPYGVEILQGVGVIVAIVGLCNLALESGSSSVPNGAITALGYLGGITAAIATVITSKLLSTHRQQKLSPLAISFVTATLGTVLLPAAFVHSSHAYALIAENWEIILGFGVIATLIPGCAFAYAGSKLPPIATATVSLQLQVWTVFLSWIFLDEVLSISQIASCVIVLVGAMICVLLQQSVASQDRS